MAYSSAEVFARVAFYPSLFYTYVSTLVSSRRWYNRIDDTLILGALPIRSIAKQLVEEEGIKGVVSVNEEYELNTLTPTEKEWRALGVEQLRVSTTDFTGTPSQDQIAAAVAFLQRHRHHGQSVYVHCKAGRTRSATVAACYLMQVNRCSPQEAVEILTSRRSQVWLRSKQLHSLAIFYSSSVASAPGRCSG